MKQVLQNLKTGATEIVEIPVPNKKYKQLLIQTQNTLISSGTERMLMEFGKAGLIKKAVKQPQKFKMVLNKIKTDGLQPTFETVFNKLNQPLPLGYCNVGNVIDFGDEITNFNLGDRVVSNGSHAEVVSVPINLCAKIPNSVSNEEASFTVLGAIALQGIRLLKPNLGETIVVTGLGLIGLMTVQILLANGCRVLGLDFDKKKLKLAKQFGAEVVNLDTEKDPVKIAELYSRGRGVDGVIITATTRSSEPIHQAALMCRKRGRIVLVGVAGLELSRDDFYKKELTFQVSASYGPGRYDNNYEDKGQDYPIGYVRWTEQRNFEAVLDMMSLGSLNVKPLITHKFDIQEAERAYKLIENNEESLGILLMYPGIKISSITKKISLKKSNPSTKSSLKTSKLKETNNINVSFIGSGNYASNILIPAFKEAGVSLLSIASSSGVSSTFLGKRFRFQETTTDIESLLNDSSNNVIVIATQHDSHAKFVIEALKAGKNIFVEKPLCINFDELLEIETEYSKLSKDGNQPILMVGFNRRFAPQIQKIKSLLENVAAPKSFIMTVNAGQVPVESWMHDRKIGGGRIIGEACHFIDLLRYLSGNPIKSWSCLKMDASTNDTVNITLKFEDGSIGTIHYYSNGYRSFPKERLEIFVQGRIIQLDNFRKLKAFGWPGFNKMNLWRQNKGQKACVKTFVKSIQEKEVSPISIEEIFEVSKISIELSK